MSKSKFNTESMLGEFSRLVQENSTNPYTGQLYVGVDLGTANIAISVIDEKKNPIAGLTYPSKVVRDGIVVDYVGAVKTVRMLKEQLEKQLGILLKKAATAIPPGISPGNIKVISNVVQAAGFEVTHIIDEPSAAACVLGIKNGAVVDVGGGTTGISVIKSGKVIFAADEPTGGTHMTLVLAGAMNVSYDEAEQLKTDTEQSSSIFHIVRPVIDKMAFIVANWLNDYPVKNVYVVGGACSFVQFEQAFQSIVKKKIIKSIEPLLVTPLGIALHASTARKN